MNERLKAVRKTLGLNQTEFGARIGVTNPAISKLEKGERNFTDQMILAICREFNVNEEWLRTGKDGNDSMFNQGCDSKLEALMSKHGLDDMSKKILRAFWELPQKKRAQASDFIYVLSRYVLKGDIDGVHNKIKDKVDKSTAHNKAKVDLTLDVDLAFMEGFPYVGEGNVDIEEAKKETSATPPANDQKLTIAQKRQFVNEQLDIEEKAEILQASITGSGLSEEGAG